MGRPKKEPKKTISFKVPVIIYEEVKEEARPIIDNIVKKKMKKLLAILVLSVALTSCTKSSPLEDQFIKITVSQGGESVLITGFIPAPVNDTYIYWVEIEECGVVAKHEVRIKASETQGQLHYQTNCKVGAWRITYDDILRQ